MGLAGATAMTGCSGSASNASGFATANLITPTITWATPASVAVGTVLTPTSPQFNATVTVPGSSTALAGTYIYSPPTTAALGYTLATVGVQTLSLTFVPTDSTHYTTATASVTLTVTAAPVVPPSNTPAYTFKNVQIVGGGYVDGIVFHPASSGLVYARTDIGGAYRYNTSTSSWVPLLDFTTRANSSLIGVESIGIDPSDATRLYLGVGEYAESYGSNGAVLVSADQGNTFTQVALPIKLGSNDNGRGAGERIQVDPNLGTKLYLGSRNNGLYTSADRGMTWSPVSTFPVTAATSGVGVVFEQFIKSSGTTGSATKTIYVGVSATGTGTDPQPLYVSNDGGTTWTAVAGAPTGMYIEQGAVGQDGNLYYVFSNQPGPNSVTGGAVYQYVPPTAAGTAGVWNNITPPRVSGYQGGYGGLSMDPEAKGTIMVSTLDHYYPGSDDLWRSLDYGKTWYSINTVGAKRDVSLSPYLLFGSTALTGTSNWPTALAIDPYNSAHVMHGNGQTILTTSNMTVSDTQTTASNWTVGAVGIEETVPLVLISPPSGPANLLSGLGDIGGFQHTTLTASPSQGAFLNPLFANGTGLDFAQSTTTIMARVGTGSNNQFGAYSTNSGTSWTPFPANPAGVTTGAGTIAVSADGSTFVWQPGDSAGVTSYTTNNGTSWTKCTGVTAGKPVIADRINAKTFYSFDSSAGNLYTSVDGGVTFTQTQTGLPKNGTLVAAYDAEGSLYLATSSGLYHTTTKGGTGLTALSTVTSAFAVSLGAAKTGSTTLTLFVGGTVGGKTGIYRSTDGGATFIEVDDAAHQYGYINLVQGDPRVFARVYLGTSGRGIIEADSTY